MMPNSLLSGITNFETAVLGIVLMLMLIIVLIFYLSMSSKKKEGREQEEEEDQAFDDKINLSNVRIMPEDKKCSRGYVVADREECGRLGNSRILQSTTKPFGCSYDFKRSSLVYNVNLNANDSEPNYGVVCVE